MTGRGRPPGQPKSGGRQKGTPNKKDAELKKAIDGLRNDGRTPLEFMLNIMLNEEAPGSLRMRAAESAAPYVHARKVQSDDSVTLKTDEGNALVEIASAVTEVLGRLKKRNEAPSE